MTDTKLAEIFNKICCDPNFQSESDNTKNLCLKAFILGCRSYLYLEDIETLKKSLLDDPNFIEKEIKDVIKQLQEIEKNICASEIFPWKGST